MDGAWTKNNAKKVEMLVLMAKKNNVARLSAPSLN
jgi:hypothetical protein